MNGIRIDAPPGLPITRRFAAPRTEEPAWAG